MTMNENDKQANCQHCGYKVSAAGFMCIPCANKLVNSDKQAQPVRPAGAQGEPVAYLHHISNNDDSESYVVDFVRTHPLSVDGGDFPLGHLGSAAAINEQLLKVLKDSDSWLTRNHEIIPHGLVHIRIKAAIEAAEAEKAKGGV